MSHPSHWRFLVLGGRRLAFDEKMTYDRYYGISFQELLGGFHSTGYHYQLFEVEVVPQTSPAVSISRPPGSVNKDIRF